MTARHLCARSIGALILCASALSTAEPIEIRVTDIWRNPIDRAQVLLGNPPADLAPLAVTSESGACSVEVPVGSFLRIDHAEFAPMVLPVEQADVRRGAMTAILFKGGAISGAFRVGDLPMATDYAILQYADPEILAGTVRSRVEDSGFLRLGHMPEGLAYITVGIVLGGGLRTTTLPVQIVNEGTNYMQFQIVPGPCVLRGRVIDTEGNPVPAELSGTLIRGRTIEGIRGETAPDASFEFTLLPEARLVLGATLDNGLMKRIDVRLSQDATVERDIRLDEGVVVAVELTEAPEFDLVDVFLMDGALDLSALRDRSDRATYIRSARNAQLDWDTPRVELPGVPAGSYTLLAIARSNVNEERVRSIVSEFAQITVDQAPQAVTLRFPVE